MASGYEVSEFVDIDEGQYHGVIDGVEYTDEPSQYSGEKQLMVKWKLTEIENEDGSDVYRTQYVNEPKRGLNPKSVLYQLFSAVLNNGQPLAIGDVYSKEQLLGKPAELFYGSYVRKDKTKGMKILSVSPPKQANVQQQGGVRRKPAAETPIDPEALAEVGAAIDKA